MTSADPTIFDQFRLFLFRHIVYAGHGDKFVVEAILLLCVAVASVACYYLTKLLLHLLDGLIKRTPTKWDDDLMNRKMMDAVSQLAPALLINWLLPKVFRGLTKDMAWISDLTSLYIVGAGVWILWVFFGNLLEAFRKRDNLRIYAVKGIFQMFKLIVLAIGIIIGISILIHKSPLVILTALGASAAILILIFQDTILGLVASVQFMANNLLHHGDWIEDKTHDVNGEVMEITLSAVKIRNWDNSVSVVPPYLLLKNSFRNYQAVRNSGRRRVDRAIYIDMNTVTFCTPSQTEHLLDEGYITEAESREHAINLRLLRHYLERYLVDHPKVATDSMLMIRQLKPTNAGLPVELYFFVTVTEWEAYEELMCDIFDHVYAVVREFGLAIFQTPAGTDLARVKS